MSVIYTYDKDVVDLERLTVEIINSTISTGNLLYLQDLEIPSPGLNLEVVWDVSLSVQDKTTLDAVIAAHPTSPTVQEQAGEEVLTEDFSGNLGLPVLDGSQLYNLQFPVQKDGVEVTNSPVKTLNFSGTNMSVSADTGGIATISVSSPTIDQYTAWFYQVTWSKEAGKDYVDNSKTYYKTVAKFEFPGTNLVNISKLEFIADSNNGTGTGAIKIVDVTSPAVVYENTSLSLSNNSPSLYTFTPSFTLPATSAIFEIQIKRVTKKIRLYSLRLS